MKNTNKKLKYLTTFCKSIFKPKLRLVRGTRLTSLLFIGASIALAAGIILGANMYYDIDTGKVMVNEIQRIAQYLEVGTSIDVGGKATTTATGITFAGQGNITAGAGSTWKTTAGALTVTAEASSLIATATDLQLKATAGDISATSSGDIYFGTGATPTERLRILSTGNVGIATSSPSAKLAVTGDVMIDGDLHFVGDQTIQGSGTLTINPTNYLYLYSTVNYIDSSGNMVLSGYASSTKVISPELEYEGDIKIDANSAGNTTITVTNEGGGVADLSVQGDITVTGGKVTLATGETINAETNDHIIITAGGSQVLDIISGGLNITGQATTSDTFYVTGGGAKITGSVVLYDDLTVENVIPESNLGGFTLGDASHYWNNIYVSTTTIGDTSSQLVIDIDDIRAPGNLTISSTGGKLVFQPNSGSDVELVLGGAGLFKIGSSGQFYIDASGNATTSGTFHAASITTDSGDATVRKSGDEIVRGVVPIFGFDLPARCKTSCNAGTYATITRVIENNDDIFPNPYPGTTRKYRFSIRYADATTTAATRTTWQVATSSDPTYVDQFTLPPTSSTDLSKGFATTTNQVSLPANDDWFLRVTTGGSGNYELQVYEILLIGIDEVN